MDKSVHKTKLSPSQTEAVKSVLGPVMCIAGPGSGKTLTIVHRLIHMIQNYDIEPTNILVVTFTKASAIEMRKRFLREVSDNSKVNFGTFHSIFFQILKKEYGYTGENILSDDTSFKIILSLLTGKDEILSSNPDIIREILDEIAYVKSSRIRPSEYKSSVLSKKEFVGIYNGYHNYLNELRLIDFEDMLIKTYELLSENETVLKFWQNKFKYILVDEFQDINKIQYDITKLLAYPENNLFVVGDDDQSIYGFRGASPAIMQEFPAEYKNCKTVVLDTNYRCSGEILGAASKVISNNKTRYNKLLKTANESGSRVIIKGFPDNHREYVYLSKLIETRLDEGVKPEEIAVLLRTNSQCMAIASKLVDADVPFNVKGNIPTLYDNRYLVPVIAYIRFLAGDYSRNNFLQFCNKPVRYITRESLTDEDIDIYDLYEYFEECEKHYVSENIKKLIYDMQMMKNMNTAAAIRYVRKVVDYENYLKNNLNLAGNFFEEISEYLDQLEQEATEYPSFVSFLDHIEDYKRRLAERKDAPPVSAINLVTYHGCKGLEYDYVYMPDCIEGITPHRLSTTPEEIEEERRMFYVAMTRARKGLYLSHSLKRNGRESKSSRFINEILISGERPVKGSRIMHEIYKAGTVLEVNGDTMTIKFDSILVPKKLSYKYCTENNLISVFSA